MPTHDIIDNRTDKLVDHIRQILPGSQSARFAVGYFFLSGLETVTDQLANVRELRLLIGNTSSRETVEQIAEGYRRLEQIQYAAEALAYPKRTEMALATEATAANVGQAIVLMDQTEVAEQFTSRAYQKLVGVDIYAASRDIKDLVRRGMARIRKKGGRVYEILEPGAPVDIPPAFSQVYEHLQVTGKVTNQDLRKMLRCDRHQAYRQARYWVEMDFLERKGGGRGVYYVIGPRLR